MSVTIIPPSIGTLIAEQARWLALKAASLRAARLYRQLCALTVAQDIAAEQAAVCASLSATAYAAEQADLEAVRVLEDAARDGLTADDLPAVEKAVCHIRRSAAADHALAEATTLPPAA
jgi:hypothetical protein